MASPYFYPPEQFWQDSVNSNNSAFNKTQNIPRTAQECVDDQTFINKWLSTIKLTKNQAKITTLCPSIPEMKQFLSEILVLCEKIEGIENTMRNHVDTLSHAAWEKSLSEINQLKQKLIEKEAILKDNDRVFDLLKKKLAKRLGKRERLKRRRVKMRKEQNEKNKKRDEDINAINLWMAEMKDELQNKKQEENIKFETDMTLRDVIKRKSEARRQLLLLKALRKLRSAKEKSAIGRGERVDSADAIIFNKNIDKLATMWSQALEKYLSEERGLKEKLEKDFAQNVTKNAHNVIPIKENIEEEIISQWRENLFGTLDAMPQRNFNGNVEAFVFNRAQWDQYLRMSDGSSQMPSGWVIPPEIPTDKWRSYLRSNTP